MGEITIKIKTYHLAFLAVAFLFFVAGFLAAQAISTPSTSTPAAPPFTTSEDTCKEYCSLAKAEYSFVKDGACWCRQEQVAYYAALNQTVTVDQIVSGGIILGLKKEPGSTNAARQTGK